MIALDASAALELLLRAATHDRLVERLLGSDKPLAATPGHRATIELFSD